MLIIWNAYIELQIQKLKIIYCNFAVSTPYKDGMHVTKSQSEVVLLSNRVDLLFDFIHIIFTCKNDLASVLIKLGHCTDLCLIILTSCQIDIVQNGGWPAINS